MSCVIENNKVKEIASQISGESSAIIANAIGIFWDTNPSRKGEYPSVEELTSFIKAMREKGSTVEFATRDKGRQVYTVVGTHIYDKDLTEVYKEDTTDRRTIFALLRNKKENEVGTNNPRVSDVTVFSGAADGSDKEWAAQASSMGIKVINYTTNSWDALSDEWKDKIEQEYFEVARLLRRSTPSRNTIKGKLVRRNMLQADKADAIFAIGTLDTNGFISGGTAYAAMRGVLRGIPVYLFDQNDNQWKVYSNGTFITTSQPTITKRAALIGTRELRDNGKQAISSILRTSFIDQQSEVTISSSQEAIEAPEDWKSVQEATRDKETTITYTPPGQKTQTYTIRGKHIYNSSGKEVYVSDGKHRNRIFANLAVKQGRAVVVEYKDKKYVVNNKGAIISVTSGDIMKWGEENGDRKAIVELAKAKFISMRSNTSQPTQQTTTPQLMQWGVTSDNSFEVSTAANKSGVVGDSRFSALNATFKPETIIDGVDVGGKTIEYVYQTVIKKSGKGKAPAKDSRLYNEALKTKEERENFSYYEAYLPLWQEWARQNPELIEELREKSKGKILTDRFAGNTIVSQARALADILNSTSAAQPNVTETPVTSETEQRLLSFKEEFTGSTNRLYGKMPQDLFDKLKAFIEGDISVLTEREAQQIILHTKSILSNTGTSNTAEVQQRSKPVVEQPKVKSDEEILASTIVAPIAEQVAVDRVFDPQTRRDRVSLIARFFSNEIDNEIKAINERKEAIDKAMIEEDLTDEQRNELREELYSLKTDREAVINRLTPQGIFNRVRGIFETYVNSTEDKRIQAELAKINILLEGSTEYSDEEKLAAAKRKAEYKVNEYNKVLKHFRALAEESCSILSWTEMLRVDPNHMAAEDTEFNEDDPDNGKYGSKEESPKDGWMTNFRLISSHESLSMRIKKVIMSIPRLDQDGYEEEDDLGNTRYLDPSYAHIAIIDKLRFMVGPDDMIPLLKELAKQKRWVEQVIETIEADDTLFSEFYHNYRKDFMSYWIQKKKYNPDGTFTIETIPVNRPEGIWYLIDQWRDNYESHTILDKDSVYNKDGSVNKENAALGLKLVNNINNAIKNLTTKDRLTYIDTKDNFNTIVKLLNMIGIDPNPAILKNALHNIVETSEGIEYTDPIMILIPSLITIFSSMSKGEFESKNDNKKDPINFYGSVYSTIAELLAEVNETAIELSIRENGKSYYSFVNPAYMGKIIKQLKDVRKDPKKFKEFIEKEYKQYDWFYDKKSDTWRNGWLELLESSEDMRALLDHKVLLNYDKREYSDWGDLDYTIVLLNEYWADPNKKSAWYHVPILSDSPSAEFIKFVRYTNGPKGTYEDIIANKMIDIINQEYDRIMLVNKRSDLFLNHKVTPLANFDVIRDNQGNIVNKGGSEFKFIPELNNLKFINEETKQEESFINRLTRLKKDKPDELKPFLLKTIKSIMNNGFEDTYATWHSMGLFEELPNGKYKHLPFKGQSEINNTIILALKRAITLMGADATKDVVDLLRDYEKGNPIRDDRANTIFTKVKSTIASKVAAGTISEKDSIDIERALSSKNYTKEALREYYWNSKYATSQIIEILTTDLAFYKDIEDFQKRFKEVHAPSLRLNTKATFRDKLVGREFERTIYLKDDEIVSYVVNNIKDIIMDKYNRGELTEYNAAVILSKYGYSNDIKKDKNGNYIKYTKVGSTSVKTEFINVADAQAYRSLSSYRAVLDMAGEWTDDMETAYEHLSAGKWSMEDFNIIWQTKKPYVYTQVNTESGVEGSSGIKTPVQHKNSEFLLLAMYDAIAGPLGKSGKLKAINDFMEENQIDVVQFESTTKVGKSGVINLNTQLTITQEELDNLNDKLSKGEISKENYDNIIEQNTIRVESYEDTIRILKDATGISKGKEDYNVIHRVSYEDYGFQTATPEHLLDRMQLIGTQVRKLTAADISEDTIFDIGGVKMTKAEWIKNYDAINTENIIQAFKSIDKKFSDIKEIEKLLLDEVGKSVRYSYDLVRACTVDPKTGTFNIPLYDPVITRTTQTILNSAIKKAIAKQQIKGGALIQVTSYGLSDDLNIVFEGEGENRRIKYFECYMPAYSRELFEYLMDENGMLDINKLPDDLRKLIGYRVPTEGKYSMVPLYIKGFLPQQNGSAIMLPAEITTISGSDFDIDKLYIMLPEFKIDKYDIQKAKFYFKKENKSIAHLSSFFKDDTILGSIDDTPIEFQEWFNKNKDREDLDLKLLKPKVRKVKYNYNKLPQEQSLAARNNAIIDMIWAVLTNPKMASEVLYPGGFDKLKSADKICTILKRMSFDQIKEEFAKLGITVKRFSDLVNVPLEELTSVAKKFKVKLDSLSPRTQVELHQRNMMGNRMIGIYANHNANHALVQHLENLELTEPINLMGHSASALNGVKASDGDNISRNNANYLAGSVDNVKENSLYGTNQNTFTGDISMLLSRSGFSPTEVAVFMNQPIVLEMTRRFFLESPSGKTKDTIMSEVIRKAVEYSGMNEELDEDKIAKNQTFTLDQLMEEICNYKYIDSIDSSKRTEYYRKQVIIGVIFKNIMRKSDALHDLVSSTRMDTANGAIGPTIGDTISKLQKIKKFITDYNGKENYPLAGSSILELNLVRKLFGDKDIDYNILREALLKSNLPYMQAFFTLGLEQSERLLGRYFPYYNRNFLDVIEGKPDEFIGIQDYLKSGVLDAKTINNIFDELLVYIMSSLPFFGNSNINGQSMSAEDKRSWYINRFPAYFEKVVRNNPDIASLDFIQRLLTKKANKNVPVSTVVFNNVGSLTAILKENNMRDWASLAYLENQTANKLALQLILYCYFRCGFAFSPSTFIHLAPTILRTAIPGYEEKLRNILTSTDTYYEFIDQYMYNHLYNRKLVPLVPNDSTIEFTDSEGNIKYDVTVSIDSRSSASDLSVVRKSLKYFDYKMQKNITKYDFCRFIAKRVDDKEIYYVLTSSTEYGDATYTRIDPLGYRNNFIEYEYGKGVNEMRSVINSSRTAIDDAQDSEDNLTPPPIEESVPNPEPSIVAAASEVVFGEDLTNHKEDNDMLNMKENKDFTDAEDKPICNYKNSQE